MVWTIRLHSFFSGYRRDDQIRSQLFGLFRIDVLLLLFECRHLVPLQVPLPSSLRVRSCYVPRCRLHQSASSMFLLQASNMFKKTSAGKSSVFTHPSTLSVPFLQSPGSEPAESEWRLRAENLIVNDSECWIRPHCPLRRLQLMEHLLMKPVLSRTLCLFLFSLEIALIDTVLKEVVLGKGTVITSYLWFNL